MMLHVRALCVKATPAAFPLYTLIISQLEERRCPRCWRQGVVKTLGKPPREFHLEDMLMVMKMSVFEDAYGFISSPEWFEEDIAHGNF